MNMVTGEMGSALSIMAAQGSAIYDSGIPDCFEVDPKSQSQIPGLRADPCARRSKRRQTRHSTARINRKSSKSVSFLERMPITLKVIFPSQFGGWVALYSTLVHCSSLFNQFSEKFNLNLSERIKSERIYWNFRFFRLFSHKLTTKWTRVAL